MRVSCLIDPSKPAILDRDHTVLVNHETYLFSTIEARDAFLKDPLRWCGEVTDPVTGMRFRPTDKSPKTEHAGRTYFFSGTATKTTFLAKPAEYANPKRTMPKM